MELHKAESDVTTSPRKRASARADPARREVALAAAAKAVGENPERRRWLLEMLEPGGMSPGRSARAHARAFRFAEALMKAGYQVTEAPSGPRGGRRFTLNSYDGPRAGLLHRLKRERGCLNAHPADTCTCFDELSDEQLRMVATLHRTSNRSGRLLYSTSCFAHMIHQYGDGRLRSAVGLYVRGSAAGLTGPRVETYAELLGRYDIDQLQTATELLAACGDTTGRTGLQEILTLLARHDVRVLRVAVELYGGNRESHEAPPLRDIVDALEIAISDGPTGVVEAATSALL